MSLDIDKITEDLKKLAAPKLEEVATQLRSDFTARFQNFVDQSKIDKLDDMLKRASDYQIKAVTASDRDEADQYAKAADAVLRQISIKLVAEKVVASKEIGAMLEAAAITVWQGFKEVATGLLGIAIKGVMTGLLGPAGGALANAAGEFLGDALKPDDGDNA